MLQVLGLTADEQDLYEALLSASPATPAELDLIAASRNWPDWQEWGPAALARLADLGLISCPPSDPLSADPMRYAAMPPDVAVERLLAAREQELAAARERMIGLAARYHHSAEPDGHGLVEIEHGPKRSFEVFVELSHGARRQFRGSVAPPPSSTPVQDQFPIEAAGLRRGVNYRIIYDRAGVDSERLLDVAESILAGEQARAGAVPFRFMVSDKPLAMLPLHTGIPPVEAFLVVRDPTLVDALAALFDLLWERALPLHVRRGRVETAPVAEPSSAEQDLLRLLVFGMTDREAADVLGLAERTVRRRVRDMMVKLDATTRFQAGYRAVQRGWLTIGGDRDQ